MSSVIRLKNQMIGLVAALALSPGLVQAQQPPRETRLFDGNEVAQDISDLQGDNSRFRLFGEGDRAQTGMRPTGNTEMFLTNTGIVDAAELNFDGQPDLFGCPLCPLNLWFDVSPIYGAPRSDWLRFIEQAPSLLNATGGGWAVSRNFPTLSQRELLASDLSFGFLFAGAQSTNDGGCQDFSTGGPAGNSMAIGLTLLAGSNCTATWPLVNGEATFLGDNPVSGDVFLAAQSELGSDFNFEWWRVDDELLDPSKFFGSFQTHGAYDDFNSSMIGRFGDVVPGGSGDPLDEGWPLGLRTEFNGFVFALPTVSNTLFWRAIIINETEEVYGVRLDYEELHVGYSIMPIRNQEANFYAEVWRGAILTAESGTGSDACPGAFPPGTGTLFDCNNPAAADNAYNQGASGMIVLKSPIGDLRNLLFTCSTGENAQRAAERAIPCTSDDFFDPSNTHAGDTITYNHFRMCGFGICSEETYAASSDRQMFGSLSSNTEDVLNGRSPGDIPGGPITVYGTFRNPNFPQQETPFAAWVPGSWDYSANGETMGGDTLFVNTCYGLPGQGRDNRTDACVVTWADTMPVGELGNPAYNNQEGNISHWGVGPFPLAAGDTTSLVIAMVTGIDSATFEAEVNNAIELYMNFFLSPEAPPVVNIVGTQIDIMNPAEDPNGLRGQVTLFWDDASDDYVDPFLEDFATKLEAAVAGDLFRIRMLNTDLVDRIRGRARDNLERILVFKSCDNGTTFTTNDTDGRGDIDCDADPANELSGSAIAAGFQAYSTLPVDAAGDAPNSFVDQLVKAGQTYLYSILGQTRGANFAIVDSADTNGDGTFDAIAPDSLVLAPQLANPLSRSTTDPNVVSVYVPASTQAGSTLPTVTFVGPDPAGSTVPFDVVLTGTELTEARYHAFFGNEFEIVRRDSVTADTMATVWEVTGRDVVVADNAGVAESTVIAEETFSTLNPNGVTLTGAELTGDVTVVQGLGLVVVREDTGEPLLVSIVLDGENTTSSEFFGRRDISNQLGDFTGFPGYLVNADNTDGGSFETAFYRNSSGDSVPTQVLPTVAWNNQLSQSNQAGGVTALGEYVVSWEDLTFGAGSPFRLNEANPDETDAAFDSSMEARAVAETGRTDQIAADAVSDALGATVTTDDLVAVRLPFTVRNLTFDREVSIAMQRRTSNSILLGNIGSLRTGQTTRDTLSVTVEEDLWIPGDNLFFIETVEVDSVVDIGGTSALVLDTDGQPIKVERIVSTLGPAVLDCGQNPRPSCNPVVGAGSSMDWLSTIPGQTLHVFYFSPFQLGSEFVFDLERAVIGDASVDAGMDIAAQLDSIKVVPNPYIVFSEYQVATPQQNDARLLFTHLPPEGTLRIFTVSGRFVQQLTWDPQDLAGNGDLFWDMRTREGNNASGGLYVFVVEAPNPATGAMLTKIGKFVIIR